jgi:hypothetical protein
MNVSLFVLTTRVYCDRSSASLLYVELFHGCIVDITKGFAGHGSI